MNLKPIFFALVVAFATLSTVPVPGDLGVEYGSAEMAFAQQSNTAAISRVRDPAPGVNGEFEVSISEPVGAAEDPIKVVVTVSGSATHGQDFTFTANGVVVEPDEGGSMDVPFKGGDGGTVQLLVLPKASASQGEDITVTIEEDIPIVGDYEVGSPPDNEATVVFQAASDSDQDGVVDAADQCPATPSTQNANGQGCSPQQLADRDGDGIANDDDNCPDVANGDQKNTDKSVAAVDSAAPVGDDFGDACDSNDDNDGLTDVQETSGSANQAFANQPTNPLKYDSDGDGFHDGAEIDAGFNPASASSKPDDPDMDGIRGAADNCPSVKNDDQSDVDGDGVGDACDNDIDGDGIRNCADGDHNAPNARDSDCDTVPDSTDNCPLHGNTDQANFDNDASNGAIITDDIGDACDNDMDGDGINNVDDAKPRDTRSDWDNDKVPDGNIALNTIMGPDACQGGPDQANLDVQPAGGAVTGIVHDAIPDACDVDQDGDGVPDKTGPATAPVIRFASAYTRLLVANGGDNCARVANPAVDHDNNAATPNIQPDSDGDGIGDACSGTDVDGDGVPDRKDVFPTNPNEWADTDEDGVGDNSDACPGHDDKLDADADGLPDGCDVIDNTLDDAGLTGVARSISGEASRTMNVTPDAPGYLIEYSAPLGAERAFLFRSDSPFVLVESQTATNGEFTDPAGKIGSKYVIAMTFTSGTTQYGLLDAQTDAGQAALNAFVDDGDYYEAMGPAEPVVREAAGTLGSVTATNGAGNAREVTYQVIIYDANGNELRTTTITDTVAPHSTTEVDLSGVDTKDGSTYEVFMVQSGQPDALVASGTLVAPPTPLGSNFVWIAIGAVLLTAIIVMAVLGVVSYKRSVAA